jgi:hypothetical protein
MVHWAPTISEFMFIGDMSVNQSSLARRSTLGSYDNAWFSFVTVNVNRHFRTRFF